MLHYVLEIILWMLPVFFAGCVIGWLARRMFGAAPKLDAVTEAPVPPAVEAAPDMAPKSVAATSGKADHADAVGLKLEFRCARTHQFDGPASVQAREFANILASLSPGLGRFLSVHARPGVGQAILQH